MEYREIGEVFEHEGATLKVVKEGEWHCVGCHLIGTYCPSAWNAVCANVDRDDHTNVIYKLVDIDRTSMLDRIEFIQDQINKLKQELEETK